MKRDFAGAESDLQTALALGSRDWRVRYELALVSFDQGGPEHVALSHLEKALQCTSEDQGAAVSSGSFVTQGMVICPCSVRSLAAIAQGHGDTLVHRAADVVLKERRKLVLVVRETPLSDIHLENMLKLSRMGVVIFPPVPAFYNHPKTIDDLVDQTILRILDQFGLNLTSSHRWGGAMATSEEKPARVLKRGK